MGLIRSACILYNIVVYEEQLRRYRNGWNENIKGHVNEITG
jgi:hypothetical protein